MRVLHVYVCTYIYISLVSKHEGLVQSFYVNRRYSVCASLSATDFQSIGDCFSLFSTYCLELKLSGYNKEVHTHICT